MMLVDMHNLHIDQLTHTAYIFLHTTYLCDVVHRTWLGDIVHNSRDSTHLT